MCLQLLRQIHALQYRTKLHYNLCPLAEIPLAPKTNFSAQVRITMKSGTVEISDAGPEILAQILKVLSHAE